MVTRYLLVLLVTTISTFFVAQHLLDNDEPLPADAAHTPLPLQNINDPSISSRCSNFEGYSEEDKCTRKVLIAPELGIEVIAQAITGPDAYVYSMYENTLVACRPAYPESFNSPLLLSVHKRQDNETFETAITRVAAATLPYAVGYEACTVIESDNPRIVAPAGSVVYEYVATPAYLKLIDAAYQKFDGKPPFDECGRYSSAGEGMRYFITQPTQASSTFVFFNGSMDYPHDLVDPASIRILSDR